MIVIHVIVAIESQHLERARELFSTVMALSRAEPGCLTYGVHTSLEESDQFLFAETWATPEAVNDHLHSAHFADLLAGLSEFAAAPPTGSVFSVASIQSFDNALQEAGITS